MNNTIDFDDYKTIQTTLTTIKQYLRLWRLSNNDLLNDEVYLFAMIEEILSILHVANGIHILTHNVDKVYLHLFENKY